MARVINGGKGTACRIESSKDGYVTISVPAESKAYKSYKQGDHVIVITTSKRASALVKRRKVSEIVAQGPIKSVSGGKIIVDAAQSPIVSKSAQEVAISKKHHAFIKAID